MAETLVYGGERAYHSSLHMSRADGDAMSLSRFLQTRRERGTLREGREGDGSGVEVYCDVVRCGGVGVRRRAFELARGFYRFSDPHSLLS